MATNIPWGIHRIGNIYAEGVAAGLPGGRWAHAVMSPYWCSPLERIRAAWWVLTGRAEALVWPQDGELEMAIGEQDGPRP